MLENWQEEKCSAFLYRSLAAVEADPVYKHLFEELAQMAEKQANIWAVELQKSGITVPPSYQPKIRARLIAWLVRHLGTKALRPILAAMKVRGMSIYQGSAIVPHDLPTAYGQTEHRHRGVKSGGNLRAAVFGMCDGLLSNASLILGVAGADVNNSFILLSGIAGLLAGAFSMGSGEYISVSSQRDMLSHQIEIEKHELDTYPEEEAAELALIYEARGLPKEEAERVAAILIQNPEKALDTLAKEELGVDPNDLVSPWGAALSSFFSFAFGACVPLLPFLFVRTGTNSNTYLMVSIGLTGLALFSVGAVLSLFTQRNAWLSGLKVLLIGAAAGSITYLIGMGFNVVV